MLVRAFALAFGILAGPLLHAQDVVILSAHEDYAPVERGMRIEPTVEIPTAAGGPVIEVPRDAGRPSVEIADSRGGPTIEIATAKTNPPTGVPGGDVRSTNAVQAAPRSAPAQQAALASAWLDLRQNANANSPTQTAPGWVKAVTMAAARGENGGPPKTLFHIEVTRPGGSYSNLLFRLFFDDKPEARPQLIARAESGAEISHSGDLGSGIDLPTSESMVIPMQEVAAIDVAVPGDGKTVRAAYLDWMKNSKMAYPINAEHRRVALETFASMPPLRAPEHDTEKFGTVAATLAPEPILLGAQIDDGAKFRFGVERQPLIALITFEVASARIDAPPELYLNGQNIGAATLMLPELADPAYRGEMEALVSQMHFRYTGWLRAQKIVAGSDLKKGDNELAIANSAGTPASAVRATQIQLKYLWDKSDYILRPTR
ncbi:MAG TPA: hypothetical protein VE758_06105 [Chthoniobacterales bacterium]|nr:hypothetical protein [Chthoniobacterales bacterium]